MRSNEERLQAVKRRASELEAKRIVRRNHFIRASALGLSLFLIIGIALFIPAVSEHAPATDYSPLGATGSIFGSGDSLGHILIAVLAFALGVAVTILFYRMSAKNREEGDGDDD